MNCLPCLRGKTSEGKKTDEKKPDDKEGEELPVAQPKENPLSKQVSAKKNGTLNKQDEVNDDDDCDGEACAIGAPSSTLVTVADNFTTIDETPNGSAHFFKFQELASATQNFNRKCLLGESGFGKVYKGTLANGKVIAVKQLDNLGTKENKEFIEEVLKLSDLRHPNIVELIGYCVDGDQRLLVYEYMSMGSIKDHLHDLPIGKKPLDWITRMKAAAGAAQAMEYLHQKVDPTILCRNFKSTNVLFNENFVPKVTDYGFANLESSNVQQRVVGTVGYALENEYTGELTLKSDVYCFGVVFLELITGRKAIDTSRPTNEQNLVSWAQPYFKDPKRFKEIVDPLFKCVIRENYLNQAVGVAALCLQEESSVRPMISDIVGALNFLTVAPTEEVTPLLITTEPSRALSRKCSLSSSSSESSSSDTDSDQELDIKIEPFNRPEPKPQPEPEHELELEQETEWESEPEIKSESEPDHKPEPGPELNFTNSDLDSYSDSESDSELSIFEPVSMPVSKLEPVLEPELSPNQEDQPSSDHGSDGSSRSIYEEDAYSEEDFSDEEKQNTSNLRKSISTARMKVKSNKKKVIFKTEGADSIKPGMKRINSSYRKTNSNKYTQNYKNTKTMHKSDSRGSDLSDVELTYGSDDEYETHRFKSTISRFSSDSRTYSGYNEEDTHGSSSGENE